MDPQKLAAQFMVYPYFTSLFQAAKNLTRKVLGTAGIISFPDSFMLEIFSSQDDVLHNDEANGFKEMIRLQNAIFALHQMDPALAKTDESPNFKISEAPCQLVQDGIAHLYLPNIPILKHERILDALSYQVR